MKLKRLLLISSLLFAMLYIQFGAAVHSAEHLFHEHEESCDVYLSAERLSNTPLASSIPTLLNAPNTLYSKASVRHLCEQAKPLPQSRAPPAFFS